MRNAIIAAVALLTLPAAAAETLKYDVTFNDEVLQQSEMDLTLGDRIVIDDVLLKDGVEVGHASGVCTFTNTAMLMALCNVTFLLPDGEISVQFVNSPPPEKHFAIIGTTGAFAGKSGSGVLTEHGDNTGDLEFTFQ